MQSEAVILVADDDENDLVLLRRAFHTARIFNPVVVVHNGQEAIHYLSGESIYGDREKHPWPALVLLDLKMPLIDGFEVLAWWQNCPARADLPIVVMSTSNHELDIQRAMTLGASAYHTKPSDFQCLVGLVQELRDRWLKPLASPR
jgi:CheY-like chemotaxis protein